MHVRGIDGSGACVCDGDSGRTGRGNVTGIGVANKESEDGVVGEVEGCVRDPVGYPCRNSCQDIGRACHGGDVVAWVVEMVCKSEHHTSVCPGKSPMAVGGPCRGRGLCPNRVRQGPSCLPCDDGKGHLADGDRETWACHDDGRRLRVGHDAVWVSCRQVGSARRSGGIAGVPLT